MQAKRQAASACGIQSVFNLLNTWQSCARCGRHIFLAIEQRAFCRLCLFSCLSRDVSGFHLTAKMRQRVAIVQIRAPCFGLSLPMSCPRAATAIAGHALDTCYPICHSTMMELKHILAFIATFEEGSINRAAQRLGSPQPSVSVLIRDLEAELQTVLFDRQARGAEATEAARTIYPHFQRVLADVDTARMSVSGRLTDMVGPLKAGLGPAITRGLLPDILGNYLDRYPSIDVRIAEGFSGRLIEWTLSGELDFAVIALQPKDRRVIARRISLEPLVMVSGLASGRAHLQPVDLSKEKDLKVVLPWSTLSIRELIDAFILSEQIRAARTVEIDSISAILDFVEAGDWVTFLPLTVISRDLAGNRFVIQPLSEPVITAEFYLIHPARRTLSAAATAFIELLGNAFLESNRRWESAISAAGQP